MKKKSSIKQVSINNRKKFNIKNNLLNNLLIFIISFIIIIFLIFIIVRDKFNINNFLLDLEKQTGLSITLNEKSSWKIYPQMHFYNSNITIDHKVSSIIIKKANVKIKKTYWPFSPFFIQLESPLINVDGIELRNANIKAIYKDKIITFNKFAGNLVEGNIEMNGVINLEKEMPFNIIGNFNNITLNTLLQQSKIATWDRLKIKLSSKEFNLNGYLKNKKKFINFLNGNAIISGSVYLMSTEEERFGAALLSLLGEKFPTISSISESVNFVLSTYGNIPSSINGKIVIKEGVISTNNIDIKNHLGKSSLNATLNLLDNTIIGKIHFYKNEKIFLETSLLGSIQNPKILVGGKVFEQNNEEIPRDIKKVFEEGINSLVDQLLKINE